MGRCGSNGGRGSYNLPLHVLALAVILIVSVAAALIPVIGKKNSMIRLPERVLFYIKHFGTGVLIATAFVHLLPTAFSNLNDECLGPFWNTMFRPMPGVIAMLGMFSIVIVEMICNRGQSHSHGLSVLPDADDGMELPLALDNDDQRLISSPRQSMDRSPKTSIGEQPDSFDKDLLNVTLLEAGIMFHSVFVGMSLSVTAGPTFLTLFIALSLHQFFEGLGLGSRIATIQFPKGSPKAWLMCLAYGLSTPCGQLIGLVARNLYDPESEFALILVGVMNAFSAGLLLHSSLVELLAEDFLSSHSYRTLTGALRIKAFGLVGFGALAMTIVGAFA